MESITSVLAILVIFGIVYTGLVKLAIVAIALVFFCLVFIWPIISLIIVEVGGTIDARKAYNQQLQNKVNKEK